MGRLPSRGQQTASTKSSVSTSSTWTGSDATQRGCTRSCAPMLATSPRKCPCRPFSPICKGSLRQWPRRRSTWTSSAGPRPSRARGLESPSSLQDGRAHKPDASLLRPASRRRPVAEATTGSLLADFDTLGLLFESMCVRSLRVYMDDLGAPSSITGTRPGSRRTPR